MSPVLVDQFLVQTGKSRARTLQLAQAHLRDGVKDAMRSKADVGTSCQHILTATTPVLTGKAHIEHSDGSTTSFCPCSTDTVLSSNVTCLSDVNSHPGNSSRQQRPKSGKRKAREMLLASRFAAASAPAFPTLSRTSRSAFAAVAGAALQDYASTSLLPPLAPYVSAAAADHQHSVTEQAATPLKRQRLLERAASVAVARCQRPTCHQHGSRPGARQPSSTAAGAETSKSLPVSHNWQRAFASAAQAAQPACASSVPGEALRWCDFDVSLPHTDWRGLEDQAAQVQALSGGSGAQRAQLLPGVQVLLVDREEDVGPALEELRCSMADCLIAIDLEWRPDFGVGHSRVALIQLASSSLCLLLRTCRMAFKLPTPLRDFLSDPEVMLVGYSWDSSDERKMQSSFKFSRRSFGGFLDLQGVSELLGYHDCGLSSLAAHVLGWAMPKSRSVSMSNWEVRRLSEAQVRYAALDALVAGHIFRGLRLWHASPSCCTVCRHPLGMPAPPPALVCGNAGCDRRFSGVGSLLSHARSKGHRLPWRQCAACGRMR